MVVVALERERLCVKQMFLWNFNANLCLVNFVRERGEREREEGRVWTSPFT